MHNLDACIDILPLVYHDTYSDILYEEVKCELTDFLKLYVTVSTKTGHVRTC